MKRRSAVIYSDSEEDEDSVPSREPELKRLRKNNVLSSTAPVTNDSAPRVTVSECIDAITSFIKSGRSSVFTVDPATAREAAFTEALAVVEGPNFQKIGTKHLSKLYEIIDRTYFKNYLSVIIKSESRVLAFRLSSRMTQRAGQLLTDKARPLHHELSISSFLLFETFSSRNNIDNRPITVNGLQCVNRLQCLLRVLEHELIHLLFCCNAMKKSLRIVDRNGAYVESFHGPTFQAAVKRFYGHTGWQHSLVTRDEVAFTQHGIEVGVTISFEYEGKTLRGKVNRVQQRVTVLVLDNESTGATLFSDGNKYLKYYVPVNHCRVAL